MSNNFIERDLADKAAKRGPKLEQLLDGFERERQRDALRAEGREGQEKEGQGPPRRGLPRGFEFRRRLNH